ncbi:MAG: PAS domain-containing protein [Nitrospirae bacterium]|nr:PAS domain-containing protein [Nitrospirota bacterium]
MRLTLQWTVVLTFLAVASLAAIVAWAASSQFDSPLLTGLAVLLVSAAVAWPAGLLLSRRLAQPLQQLAEVVRGLARGRLDQRTEPDEWRETAELGQALNQMAEQLQATLADISTDRARLQAVLASMVEGVLVLDRRGRVLLINDALRRMLPGADPSAIGRPFIEVIRHHPLNEFVRSVLEGGEGRRQEVALLTPEERIFLLQASVAKPEGERGVAVVLVFHDITELKRLERIRKDFVANASHELKTPLTSIAGYVEALIDGAKDDPATCAQFLGIIRKHTENLKAILSDLLQLSTIESGVYRWKRQEVAVADLVERAARVLRPVAERRRQTLTVRPCEASLTIHGDLDRLTEALINLLDNAVKYTPEGGAVTIETTAVPDGVRITVADTGIGIPPKELSRIFERFYRVDRARSREQGGTGLGLSIVKHIVEAHGGRITVDSTVGRGSTFTLLLPAQPAFS